jgi:hypothetical protein
MGAAIHRRSDIRFDVDSGSLERPLSQVGNGGFAGDPGTGLMMGLAQGLWWRHR